MDVISRLPGCAGQAADAGSAYTQVKMEDEPLLFTKIRSQNVDIWMHPPKHKWCKSWSVLLNAICTVILWQDCYGNGSLRKFYWNMVWRRFPIGNASSYTVKRTILVCVCGRFIKTSWKETQRPPNVENPYEISQIAPELATNAKHVWSHTSIKRVNSNKIVMWEIQHNNAFRWSSVYFWKSHVRTNKLDVQETEFSFTQFYRSWGKFSPCRFTHGCNTSSWSLGFGFWSVSFFTKPSQQHQRSSTRKLVA